jgi:hypothetical protein
MTTIPTATLEDLKRLAKAGDREALQQLRDSGFFQQQRAARDGYPISHGQRRLWVLSQIAGSAPAYHIPLALLLEGELDIAALAKALDVIVARHESLRTTFATVGAEVRQFVHEHSTFRLQTLDLSAAANPTVQARALAEQHATTPFDLSTGPLLRATLVRLAPQCHVFLFNIHHIVCDAWSLGVLVRELTALYQACTRGLKDPLSPLRIHYKDFTAWQNGLLAGPEAEQRRRYWHAKLAGAPALDLPLDFPRPAVMGFAGGTVCTTLDGGQLRELQCRVQGISPFIVLVALVKVLLYRYTGQRDITVGCPITGREHPDLEGQIGFFVNTLVLRDRLNGQTASPRWRPGSGRPPSRPTNAPLFRSISW